MWRGVPSVVTPPVAVSEATDKRFAGWRAFFALFAMFFVIILQMVNSSGTQCGRG
jgi:hypothetical protein